MSGRGYSVFPYEPKKGVRIRHLPTGFIKGYLIPNGNKNPKLTRSLERELERRGKR